MGFSKAVFTCYKKMFTLRGRASRSEYWWFQLYIFVASLTAAFVFLQTGAFADMVRLSADQRTTNPDFDAAQLAQMTELLRANLPYWIAGFFLFTVPGFTVLVRRLHDTNRRGWWMLVPSLVTFVVVFVASLAAASLGDGAAFISIIAMVVAPIATTIWFFIVLVSRGTDTDNRFGPDPLQGRGRGGGHPAFAQNAPPAERAELEAQRRADMKDYYRKNVLGQNAQS